MKNCLAKTRSGTLALKVHLAGLARLIVAQTKQGKFAKKKREEAKHKAQQGTPDVWRAEWAGGLVNGPRAGFFGKGL